MDTNLILAKSDETLLDNTAALDSEASSSKERIERRVSFIHGGELVETIVSASGLFQFAVSGKLRMVDSIETKGARIVPPFNLRAMCETGLVRFPSNPAPYVSAEKLIQDIKEFIRRYASVPEEWLSIIALYILMTWVYDRFTAVPYLRFLGEPGTGKTRLLQICAAVSYKGIVASGNITGPALFRTIDLVRGTMAVDEADFKNSEEWSDITKVLNNGYTTGAPVVRCERTGSDFTPQAFYVFGPKIISTRSRFADEALETRCLTFETRYEFLPEHVPLQLPLTFEEEALKLRNKLLMWRFDNFNRTQANEEGLRELSPRSGQIGASLAAVAPNGEIRKSLMSFLALYDAGRKKDSDKGFVLEELRHLRASSIPTATVGTIADSTNITRKDLGLEPLTPKRVGGILRSLGIIPHRTKSGYVVDVQGAVLPGERDEHLPSKDEGVHVGEAVPANITKKEDSRPSLVV